MGSIIENIVGATDIKLNDQIIANDTLFGLKGAATAYLAATMESSTPEVRRMWSEYLSQTILAQEAMAALAIKRGWYKPYINPDEQISQVYEQSQSILRTEA